VWQLRSAWCLLNMAYLAHTRARLGANTMSVHELHIYVRVLMKSFRHQEALRVVAVALRRPDITPDETALLRLTYLETPLNSPDDQIRALRTSDELAKLASQCTPKTQVSVYRGLSQFHRRRPREFDNAVLYTKRADDIAAQFGINDNFNESARLPQETGT
jgi:hypothetical protein